VEFRILLGFGFVFQVEFEVFFGCFYLGMFKMRL